METDVAAWAGRQSRVQKDRHTGSSLMGIKTDQDDERLRLEHVILRLVGLRN